MYFPKPIRFLARLVLFAALALLCLLLSIRWWLPAVLPQILALSSVEVERIERVEEGKLRLDGLSYRDESLTVAIDQLTIPSLLVYLRDCWSGSWSRKTNIDIGSLAIQSKPSSPAVEVGEKQIFLPQAVTEARRVLRLTDRWLPPIEVGVIEVDSEGVPEMELSSLRFSERRISGRFAMDLASLAVRLEFAAELSADAPWDLSVTQAHGDFSAEARLRGEDGVVVLSGAVLGPDSRLNLEVVFGRNSWVPDSARFASSGFNFGNFGWPLSDDLRLGGLVVDQAESHWDGAAFDFALKGMAQIDGDDGLRKSVSFDLAGGGREETVNFKTLELSAPWAAVQLSDPIAIDWRRGSVTGDARFQAKLDLSKIPFAEASGEVGAILTVSDTLFGRVGIELDAKDISYGGYEVARITASGRYEGDQLMIQEAFLSPTGAAGDACIVSGRVDLANRICELDFHLSLRPDWLNRTLGQEIFDQALEVESGRVIGDWTTPEVTGKLKTVLSVEPFFPAVVDGHFSWNGERALHWSGDASVDGAALLAKLLFEAEERGGRLTIESLSFVDENLGDLQLSAPSVLTWAEGGSHFEEMFQLSPFILEGGDTRVAAGYHPKEGLTLDLEEVSIERLTPWIQAQLPQLRAERIHFDVSQLRPFLEGALRVEAEERVDSETLVRLETGAKFEENGTVLDELSLRFGGQQVLEGFLNLPLQFRFRQQEAATSTGLPSWIHQLDGELAGRLDGESSPAMTTWLKKRTGIQVEEAGIDLELSGDLENPVGLLSLQLASLQGLPPLGEHVIPDLREIALDLEASQGGFELKKLGLALNQSRITAGARAPYSTVREALQRENFDSAAIASQVSGEIQLVNWKMENWVDSLPPIFRRTGQMNGMVTLESGLRWGGFFEFEGLSLRPTATLSAVDQIGGRLNFEGREVTLDEARAYLGGQRVSMSGALDLSRIESPRWWLELEGSNLPIRRSTDMILRSDLDLRVDASKPSEPTRVEGDIQLRSSTMLVDIDPLAPRLSKGTSASPPFFRVTEDPFADWLIDLKLTGDEFMRIRSPYFRAELSADFTLSGSLSEPLLIGAVRTSEAELNFPGAKFAFDEGEAFIETSRPNELQLAFNGIAQKASRVIAMEVSQTLQDPLIQFESTPPMSQAQILRLLATGSTSGGVGNLGLYLGQGILGAGTVNEGFSDRLSIDVGEETSRSGRSTLGVSYELTPRWSLEGEYDVFDAYNADLIWTIFKE